MSKIILLVILAFIGAGLIGACGPRQFTTLTIYDKPAAYVRLEFDRRVSRWRGIRNRVLKEKQSFLVLPLVNRALSRVYTIASCVNGS
jgi:hypothetical protein